MASGQSGAWRSFPGRSSVTGLPPPHPRRGSRWPNYREGVGRPNRGRGMGEEIEQAKGGWVWGWPGGCLTSKCAGNANEPRSFMARCPRTGEPARFCGGGTGDGSQVGELPGCWGRASCDGLAWGGEVFVRGLRGPSFLPHFKGRALPSGNNLTQVLLGSHCPGYSGSL